MVNKKETKEIPVFIAPKKRQSNKKINGSSQKNYVDHIVTTQNHSPEEDVPKALKVSNEDFKKSVDAQELNNCNNKIVSNVEEKELQNFDNFKHLPKEFIHHSITPTSYSESSLNKSHECLTTKSSKKRVNYRMDLHEKEINSPTISNYEDLESGETSVLNGEIEGNSLDRYNTRRSIDSYLTMTGTIKRGKQKGQSLDIQLNISREELEKINAVALATVEQVNHKHLCCICSLTTGLHILILSIICLPFVTLVTSIYSFYIGTLTWYNMFSYFNEEKSYIYKLFMSPLLILAYPLVILLCTIGLGFYAGFIQLSLRLTSWLNEICDMEKGFYGWLCGFLRLSDCSPYEVIILTDLQPAPDETRSSTEELSL